MKSTRHGTRFTGVVVFSAAACLLGPTGALADKHGDAAKQMQDRHEQMTQHGEAHGKQKQHGEMSQSAEGKVQFGALDADHNGYLSESELQDRPELASQLDSLDSNGDGRLSRMEFWAYEDAKRSGVAETAGAAAAAGSAAATAAASATDETTDDYAATATDETTDEYQYGQTAESGQSGSTVSESSEWQSDSSQQTAQTGEQQGQSASSQSESSSEGPAKLQQLAQEHEDLETFVKALEQSGLSSALTDQTSYTVFAPTNEAFESMSGRSVDELMKPENKEELRKLLRAHIVADDVDPQMARNIREARTIDGGKVSLETEEDELKVADAKVVESDIQQGKLRIYAIDQVLESSSMAMASAEVEEQETSSQQTAQSSGSTADWESSTRTDTAATDWESTSDTDTAAAAAGAAAGATAAMDFSELDEDGDGYLSDSELNERAELAEEQQRLDTDNDGRISRTEFAAFERTEIGPTESSEQPYEPSGMPERQMESQQELDINPEAEPGEAEWPEQ